MHRSGFVLYGYPINASAFIYLYLSPLAKLFVPDPRAANSGARVLSAAVTGSDLEAKIKEQGDKVLSIMQDSYAITIRQRMHAFLSNSEDCGVDEILEHRQYLSCLLPRLA